MGPFLTEDQLNREAKDMELVFPNKVVSCTKIIEFCQDVLAKYREIIGNHEFDISSEIKFFKEQKQIPLSTLIFYNYLRSFYIESPSGEKLQRDYIELKLEKISKFFIKNSNFITYLDLEENYLDEFYFTRKYNLKSEFSDCNYYPDFQFNTTHDFLLAKIKANRNWQNFLQDQLKVLDYSFEKSKDDFPKFQWTSSKVALVELIYALQAGKSLNSGTSDIIAIASGFEKFFDIKLDNIYKTFAEIKYRKGRRTKFLDDLTVHLESRMEQDDQL